MDGYNPHISRHDKQLADLSNATKQLEKQNRGGLSKPDQGEICFRVSCSDILTKVREFVVTVSVSYIEIDLKLHEMAAQRKTVSEVERTLHELKAQEERNTNLLESMMAQLLALQGDPLLHITQGHKQQYVTGSDQAFSIYMVLLHHENRNIV